MHGRVDRWVVAAGSKRQVATNLIAGLIPRAAGVADAEMARTPAERDQAMERRARELAGEAIESGQAWVRGLGAAPGDPGAREAWAASPGWSTPSNEAPPQTYKVYAGLLSPRAAPRLARSAE